MPSSLSRNHDRGPVRPTPQASALLRPEAMTRITGGFWAERRRVNARASIPQGPALLESAGNLHNLALAAGTTTGEYRGDLPFLDSDVTKWLEAAAWQLGDPAEADAEGLPDRIEELTALLAAAQEDSGYLNSWFQVIRPKERFEDLRWGHELYCAGHLIQAAVALHRTTGARGLLDIAVRFADHIDDTFGPGRPLDGICGHAEIETALVELYRETGERRYLDLAGYFVDRHGHGLLNVGERHASAPGPAYCQDRVPVREARNVEGHAVRQLYLLAGATDVATETGEPELREAVVRLWDAMTATKTHLTGGLGARHEWEDFGDPYELPTDRTYCETCAAVASVQWSWRMALMTGRARYSDLVERTLYNGFLAGVSLDGERWLYVNPLQVRDGYTDEGTDQTSRRTRWFRCACCPPNVMRLLASLPAYCASTDGSGLQIHQYVTGSLSAQVGGEDIGVDLVTGYPVDGRIELTLTCTSGTPWTLSVRLPHWSRTCSVTVDGEPVAPDIEGGWARLRRSWSPGQRIVLELDVEARLTRADPRVDAVRGSVAIERGPLVYCLEQTDHPGGGLDDVTLDATRPLRSTVRPDLLGGVVTVEGAGPRGPPAARSWWPYSSHGTPDPAAPELNLTAVPYYAWANREDGAMRVWIPLR
ncbi:beta-L-arabinofuranosidase domain-containing protein [Streptomyces sp. NPDC005899]|uniref:glycoside hydrolase family 127 protein n=1 Tax=Streptomyces sp. NPDC005899 TaxID=3155716 RepID=UPI0033F90BB1